MVIENKRIHSAGVLLPLTEDPKLSWKYGTRHRAAIGMSEVSDAACLVVSEETGAISVARNGTLTIDISDGDLRDILMNEFVPSGSASDDKIITKLVRRVKK